MGEKKYVVMLGTHYDTMGGISAVVNVYRTAGLFKRFKIKYLATHRDGNMVAKLQVFASALAQYLVLIVTGKVALVHVHVASRASFWRKCFFLLPAFAFRIPTIVHLHGGGFADFYEKECGTGKMRLIEFVFNTATRIVVLSLAWQDWVRGMCKNPMIQTVFNPVIVPQWPSPWSKRSNSEVLFLGRLGKQKGTYDLVEAAAKLKPSIGKFQLLLGGDGDLEGINARVISLGIKDEVKLLGWVRGPDKERYLCTARIYVLPSYHEGLPMSILEAMAAGIPVISTPIGGIPDAISDGVEGFLVPLGNIEMLASRLELLLRDDELAKKMGEAARAKVLKKFSAEAVIPHVERIYNELGISAH